MSILDFAMPAVNGLGDSFTISSVISLDVDSTSPVASPAADTRPEITVTTDEHDVIARAVEAVAIDPDIYQRCNLLVTVVRDAAPKKKAKRRDIRRQAGNPRIVHLPNPRLREILSRRIRFVKERKDRNGEVTRVPAHPPDWCVSGIAARGEWDGIRPLEGVIEAPTLRPDGSILDRPGWDEETGLLYEQSIEFPPIPTSPTKDDAERAAALLLDLVSDFPFAKLTREDGSHDGGAAHRAAWLASIMTPMVRHAITGPCPLFLFDANCPGTGKSKLCDLASIIATGRTMARAGYPGDEAEMSKTLLAIAIAADSMILFDNVAAGWSIGGESLDRVLTAGTTKGRPLGRTEMTPDIPVDTVFYATGNNLGLKGDALRRVVPCRLETDEERPEERRGFRHANLIEHTRDERPALVAAVLTIVRAYAVAGRPAPNPPLVPMDYTEWCDLIRHSVHWATGVDPCEPRRELVATDPESSGRAALVEGWAELPGAEKGLTVAEALGILREDDAHSRNHGGPRRYARLWDSLVALSRTGDLPTPRSVGMRLTALKSRVVAGKSLVPVPIRSGMQAWKVVGIRATPDGGTGDSGWTIPYPDLENWSYNCNTKIRNRDGGESHQSIQSHQDSGREVFEV